MHNKIIHALGLGILGSALALTGCSSSDDAAAVASVPANAKTITTSNAEPTVEEAISTSTAILDAAEAAAAIEISRYATAMDLVNLVDDIRTNGNATSTLSTPLGITTPFTCSSGGGSATTNTTTNGESGSVTFTNCDDGFGVINGTMTWSYSEDGSSNYTQTAGGGVTILFNGITITFSGLNYNETGNDITNDYSINTFTYTIDLSIGGGYLAELSAPIVGTGTGCPTSGTVLVTGASDTQARGILGDPNITIEFNDGGGTFVEADNSPVNCTDYFPI